MMAWPGFLSAEEMLSMLVAEGSDNSQGSGVSQTCIQVLALLFIAV